MDPVFILCLVALGATVGFVAGLLGIGGGMMLVPFLAMLLPLYGVPQELVVHAAIATGMATIVFTSISSMRAHHRQRAIRWDIVWIIGPGLIVGGLLSGGAVFSYLSGVWLSLFFAVFVGYSAYRMLTGKPPVPGHTLPSKPTIFGVGLVIGFVSGFLGAGGGFLSVPFMARGNVPMRNAVATSAALGFFIAIANSAGYIYSGFQEVKGQPGMLGYIYRPALIALSVMSVLTAPVGARYTHALPVATLKRLFACLLFAMSLYMLFKGWQQMQLS